MGARLSAWAVSRACLAVASVPDRSPPPRGSLPRDCAALAGRRRDRIGRPRTAPRRQRARVLHAPDRSRSPATGNLTDDVVRNAAEAADAVVVQPASPGPRPGRTSPRRSSCAEVSGVAKGLVAAGVEAGDRVALISRTRYEWTLLDYAIWFAGAVTVPDLRDLLGRAGRLDPAATRRPRRGRREPPPTRAGSPRSAADLAELEHVWSHRRQRRRRAHRGSAPTSPTTSSRSAGRTATPARPGHPHLHLGHHRPPQGLHAHPRQLHDRARRRRRRARRAVRHRGRLDAALPAAGPRVRPDHPGRRGEGAASGWATAPTSRTSLRRPRRVPADVRAGRAAGVREGLQHRLAEGHRRRPGQDLRPRRRDRDRLLRGARPRAGPSLAVRAQHARVRPARLRQAARRARRPVRVRRLRRRAARRAARPLLPRHRPAPCSRATA